MRALWINKVAAEWEIKRVGCGRAFPKMPEILDKIKEAYFPRPAAKDAEAAKRAELVEIFFPSIEETWTTLHSYTHPGGLQVIGAFPLIK